MIKESIEYLANKIQSIGLFENVYSLVEIVSNSEGRSFPAIYSTNGKYNVIHYSFNNGTAYLRKNGVIQFTEIEGDSFVGCSYYHQINIPLMLVVFKNKSKLPIDCSYSEELLAETIISYLTNNTKDARQTLFARQFKVLFNSINTDSASVWETETNDVEQKDVNYNIACVSFDITLQILVDPKCMNNFCDIPT